MQTVLRLIVDDGMRPVDDGVLNLVVAVRRQCVHVDDIAIRRGDLLLGALPGAVFCCENLFYQMAFYFFIFLSHMYYHSD